MDNNNLNEYEGGNGNRPDGGNGNRGGNKNNNNKNQRPSGWMAVIFTLMLVALGFLIYNMFFSSGKNYTVKEYTEFLKDLDADKVESIEINAEKALMTVTLKLEAVDTSEAGDVSNGNMLEQYAYSLQLENERVYQTYVMEPFETLTPKLVKHDVLGKRVVSSNSGMLTEILVGVVIPVVLIAIIMLFFMRRMSGSGGFGYDPIFYNEEMGGTFAEVSEDEKNAVSHRGKAVRQMVEKLKELGLED